MNYNYLIYRLLVYEIFHYKYKYINKREREREINNNAISIFFGLLFQLNETWN